MKKANLFFPNTVSPQVKNLEKIKPWGFVPRLWDGITNTPRQIINLSGK